LKIIKLQQNSKIMSNVKPESKDRYSNIVGANQAGVRALALFSALRDTALRVTPESLDTKWDKCDDGGWKWSLRVFATGPSCYNFHCHGAKWLGQDGPAEAESKRPKYLRTMMCALESQCAEWKRLAPITGGKWSARLLEAAKDILAKWDVKLADLPKHFEIQKRAVEAELLRELQESLYGKYSKRCSFAPRKLSPDGRARQKCSLLRAWYSLDADLLACANHLVEPDTVQLQRELSQAGEYLHPEAVGVLKRTGGDLGLIACLIEDSIKRLPSRKDGRQLTEGEANQVFDLVADAYNLLRILRPKIAGALDGVEQNPKTAGPMRLTPSKMDAPASSPTPFTSESDDSSDEGWKPTAKKRANSISDVSSDEACEPAAKKRVEPCREVVWAKPLDKEVPKIYVCGSLQNIPAIRRFCNKLEVFFAKYTKTMPNIVDAWTSHGSEPDQEYTHYCKARGWGYTRAIREPVVKAIFEADKTYIEQSDAVICYGPAGKSAYAEMGYARGLCEAGSPKSVLFIKGLEDPTAYSGIDCMEHFAHQIWATEEEFWEEFVPRVGLAKGEWKFL